jgi:MSHA pilin protein MshD
MGYLRETKGLTLIEIMLAMTILVIAVIPLMKMLGDTIKGAQTFGEITIATQLAQDLMEEIKSKKWDETEPNDGTITTTPTRIQVDNATHGLDDINNENVTQTPGNGKTNWDDMDDYDGLTETPSLDTNNNVITNYGKFSRTVEVRYVTITQTSSGPPPVETVALAGPTGMGSGGANPTTDFKRIIVIVNWVGNKGKPVQLTTIRANYRRY